MHLVVPGVWRGVDYPALATSVTGGIESADHRVVGVTVVDRTLPEADPTRSRRGRDPPGTEADPLRWIFYTSGTTARPEGRAAHRPHGGRGRAPAEPRASR